MELPTVAIVPVLTKHAAVFRQVMTMEQASWLAGDSPHELDELLVLRYDRWICDRL